MSLSIFLPYTCTLLLKKSLGKDHLLLAGSRPAFPFLNRLGRLSPLSSECESGSKKIFFLCVLVFLHSCSLVVKEPKIFDTTLCCSVPPTLKKKGLRTNSGVCWCYYYCCSSVCQIFVQNVFHSHAKLVFFLSVFSCRAKIVQHSLWHHDFRQIVATAQYSIQSLKITGKVTFGPRVVSFLFVKSPCELISNTVFHIYFEFEASIAYLRSKARPPTEYLRGIDKKILQQPWSPKVIFHLRIFGIGLVGDGEKLMLLYFQLQKPEPEDFSWRTTAASAASTWTRLKRS